MQPWPDYIFDFAWFHERDDQLRDLAEQAEEEDWQYKHKPNEHQFPILFNYISYTYKQLAKERKIGLSEIGDFCCFNTGLVTSHQEPLFALFQVNSREDARQQWYFKGWFRQGQRELNIFSVLPELAHYFDDPSVLVFDARKDFRINTAHIIESTSETRTRFPEPYGSMDPYALEIILDGAVSRARERSRRNYKTAIPQYYNDQIQLLLPLNLENPQRADLALVVEIHEGFYRAATCLDLDMAYNNARLLAKPDRDWLQP